MAGSLAAQSYAIVFNRRSILSQTHSLQMTAQSTVGRATQYLLLFSAFPCVATRLNSVENFRILLETNLSRGKVHQRFCINGFI